MNTYRFGKHPPKHDYRTLRLKDYLKPGLEALPPRTTCCRTFTTS